MVVELPKPTGRDTILVMAYCREISMLNCHYRLAMVGSRQLINSYRQLVVQYKSAGGCLLSGAKMPHGYGISMAHIKASGRRDSMASLAVVGLEDLGIRGLQYAFRLI